MQELQELSFNTQKSFLISNIPISHDRQSAPANLIIIFWFPHSIMTDSIKLLANMNAGDKNMSIQHLAATYNGFHECYTNKQC